MLLNITILLEYFLVFVHCTKLAFHHNCMLCNRGIWMECTNNPEGVIVYSCV